MKEESSATIFNSAKRGFRELPAYKCFSTFDSCNAEKGFNESFGQLTFLNDAFLSPKESITHRHEEDTRVVILPLTGALSHHNEIQKPQLIQSEQIKIMEVEKEMPYVFTNPFEKEWVNYLHMGFKVDAFPLKNQSVLQNIELKKMNEPACFVIHAPDQLIGQIGIYEGRMEGSYTLNDPANGVFVYVIGGAFEVQGRLLEYRDGLSLWNTPAIEFEALSNNAILMILETKLTQ